MSFVTGIGHLGGVLTGMATELIDTFTNRVVLPVPILAPVPVGDVLEPIGAAARSGADMVERAMDALFGGPGRVDANEARTRRRLLAATTVMGTGAAGVSIVQLHADASGTDWGVKGHESARVSVYVDGRYHSSVVLLSERDGTYRVNLGSLTNERHRVEIRDESDMGVASSAPVVDALRGEALTGTAALVQRYAPVLQLRDTDASGVHSSSHDDTPLLLVPAVTHEADGSTTIAYRVGFSNENGGTPTPYLMSKYGRTMDLEPIFKVRIAADGRVVERTYQSALHQWKPFDGDTMGDRPVLRVSTANNNYSARVRRAGDGEVRWSEAALDAVSASTTDFDVMRANPWTFTVTAKEVLREGKTVAAGQRHGYHTIFDPRRYLYVGGLSDAALGAAKLAGGIEVVLDDGRHVLARVGEHFAEGGFHQSALELPDGVSADAVRGVALLGVQAVVLDARLRMRAVDSLPAAVAA